MSSCDQAENLEGKTNEFLSFINVVRAEVCQLKAVFVAGSKTDNVVDPNASGLADSSLEVSYISAHVNFIFSFSSYMLIFILICLLIQ